MIKSIQVSVDMGGYLFRWLSLVALECQLPTSFFLQRFFLTSFHVNNAQIVDILKHYHCGRSFKFFYVMMNISAFLQPSQTATADLSSLMVSFVIIMLGGLKLFQLHVLHLFQHLKAVDFSFFSWSAYQFYFYFVIFFSVCFMFYFFAFLFPHLVLHIVFAAFMRFIKINFLKYVLSCFQHVLVADFRCFMRGWKTL